MMYKFIMKTKFLSKVILKLSARSRCAVESIFYKIKVIYLTSIHILEIFPIYLSITEASLLRSFFNVLFISFQIFKLLLDLLDLSLTLILSTTISIRNQSNFFLLFLWRDSRLALRYFFSNLFRLHLIFLSLLLFLAIF